MSRRQCHAAAYDESVHESQMNTHGEVEYRDYGEDNCVMGGCYGR